ncbi:hypothetical protein SLH49_05220 [Cognatiyoonia sp. IB215446]|uniref:hypothetical protein n=1 Tax=Cognatiyoonia sp. IB215446 TaxID=3097355 RepID=UPI002A1252AE|nr:hypothetical protein [Cognatiyoonia sp. IB215446]MDX8347382.1 hypothetical protein [Cognatiyoonia sp. IB215446]
MSAFFGAVLALGFALSLSHVSDREAVLYSGLYPPTDRLLSLGVGDIFFIDDDVAVPMRELREICPGFSLVPKDDQPRTKIEVRSVVADTLGPVATWMPTLNGAERTLTSNTISGPEVVSQLGKTDASEASVARPENCETLVASRAEGRCIVIVTNVQRASISPTESELFGFSFPRGCQLIGFKNDPEGWSQPRVSFDRAFGVGRLERLWIQFTQPLIQIVEKSAD